MLIRAAALMSPNPGWKLSGPVMSSQQSRYCQDQKSELRTQLHLGSPHACTESQKMHGFTKLDMNCNRFFLYEGIDVYVTIEGKKRTHVYSHFQETKLEGILPNSFCVLISHAWYYMGRDTV